MINWDLAGGPGFFIFFHEEGPQSGAGYPIIFITTDQEKKEVKKLKKKVKQFKKAKDEIVISQESIDTIVEAMVSTWDAEPSIQQYDIDYQEALWRYKEYIRLMILDMQEEDLALILIFANI